MSTNLADRLEREARNRDIARLALQMAAATLLSFAGASLLVPQQTFIAAIAAGFVIQADRDQTLTSAAMRMVGTAIGLAVGLAAIFTLGQVAPWLALGAGMLVVGAITAWQPGLRYGVIVVISVTVGTQGQAPLDVAQSRGIAIVIGLVASTIVGFAVWPEGAAARTRRNVRRALALCRTLLDRTAAAALGEPADDTDPLHDRIMQALQDARTSAAAIRTHSQPSKDMHETLVRAARRLWHSIIIIDRAHGGDGATLRLPDEERRRVEGLRARGGRALERLDGWHRAEPGDLAAVSDPHDPAERRAGLLFALGEVERSLSEIDERIGATGAGR